jgi:hypothetical protein
MKRSNRNAFVLTYVVFSLAVYIVLAATSFFGDIVIPFNRIAVFVFMTSEVAIIMGVMAFHAHLSATHVMGLRKIAGIGAAACLVSVLFVVGTGSFFQSPRTGLYNSEVTAASLEGHEWLVDFKSDKIQTAGILEAFFRYIDVSLGPSESRSRVDAHPPEDWRDIPEHFGYENGSRLGDYYSKPIYVSYDSAAVGYYTRVFPSQGSFTSSDFDSLQMDATVDRILDNGCAFSYWVVPADGA